MESLIDYILNARSANMLRSLFSNASSMKRRCSRTWVESYCSELDSSNFKGEIEV